jgi:hypothetical protein
MSDDIPTHVIANPGDKRSLCGVKKPLPRVWVRFVDAHVEGHGMVVCPECASLIGGRS